MLVLSRNMITGSTTVHQRHGLLPSALYREESGKAESFLPCFGTRALTCTGPNGCRDFVHHGYAHLLSGNKARVRIILSTDPHLSCA